MGKETFLVIGIGGTGSYFINNLINYLNGKRKHEYEVILVDGDVLEDRNLLRQGFLRVDVGKNKSKALSERFSKLAGEHIRVMYRDNFVIDINEMKKLIDDDVDRVTLISCVDNNMARLRMLMAQYAWYEENQKPIHFIDGGNNEWEGQVIINKLEKIEPPLIFEDEQIRYNDKTDHKVEMIFKGNKDWKNSLSRGDFELSCEEITESAPQNILANMTSAVNLMKRVYDRKNVRTQFDVSTGIQEELDVVEEDNVILKDIIDFLNTEGNYIIYPKHNTEELIERNQEEESEEEIDEETLTEYLEIELGKDFEEDKQQGTDGLDKEINENDIDFLLELEMLDREDY